MAQAPGANLALTDHPGPRSVVQWRLWTARLGLSAAMVAITVLALTVR